MAASDLPDGQIALVAYDDNNEGEAPTVVFAQILASSSLSASRHSRHSASRHSASRHSGDSSGEEDDSDEEEDSEAKVQLRLRRRRRRDACMMFASLLCIGSWMLVGSVVLMRLSMLFPTDNATLQWMSD